MWHMKINMNFITNISLRECILKLEGASIQLIQIRGTFLRAYIQNSKCTWNALLVFFGGGDDGVYISCVSGWSEEFFFLKKLENSQICKYVSVLPLQTFCKMRGKSLRACNHFSFKSFWNCSLLKSNIISCF